jgi:hypothetical protein
MPYYYFDLVIGNDCNHQGGLKLEDLHTASDQADQLASELRERRSDLNAKCCAVRVTDGDYKELYRTPLGPIPPWRRSRH